MTLPNAHCLACFGQVVIIADWMRVSTPFLATGMAPYAVLARLAFHRRVAPKSLVWKMFGHYTLRMFAWKIVEQVRSSPLSIGLPLARFTE
jgi:hypothetical protein